MKKSIYSQQYQVLLDWLIEARKNADLTQQQVADKLGRPQSFVAKYEAVKDGSMSLNWSKSLKYWVPIRTKRYELLLPAAKFA
jgi:transcriptional regulator with XRE-family HTH domain